MVKFTVPNEVGMPLIAPVEAFRVRPAGSEPALTDHVYGETPPVAETLVLSSEPSTPFGSVIGVMARAEFVVMLTDPEAVRGGTAESTTCTLKFVVPVAVGVPEIRPVDPFSDKPVGSVVPPVKDHVSGGTAPEAVRLAAYGRFA